MILFEFEGKNLLKNVDINLPPSKLITSPLPNLPLNYPIILKAQVLSGKRAQAGGIITVNDPNSLELEIKNLLKKQINKEQVTQILAEEKINIAQEFYLALTYDTDSRNPILTLSESGGTGIEERQSKTYPIDCLDHANSVSQIQSPIPIELIQKFTQLFFEQDCLLLEVNPLVKTTDNQWFALDAKIKLDDTALGRHPEWHYPPRSAPGYAPTEREIAAKKIDEADYRGTAGSTYFDLPGDIAILASGGGGSLTAMDALLKAGGRPANYTEYSGNPPREKVQKLTEIVLSKPGLNALWVVGAIANLTDIYETLSGIVDGLRSAHQKGTKLDFPIIIRRAGPRDKEAFEMLQTIIEFNIYAFGTETSITQAAQIVTKLAKEYQENGPIA